MNARLKPTPRSTPTLRRLAMIPVALAATAMLAQPALAQEIPKTGATCKMSGMAVTMHGSTWVCQASGTNLKWSKALPVSKSQLTAKDTWVKVADSSMTAAFGSLVNPTSKPINVIAVQSKIAPVVQMHEVVMKDGGMVMQQKPGGFVVPAKGSLELKPGGNHFMFMDLTKPVKAGDMVSITLTMSDGSQMTFKALGKVFAGGNEEYDPGSM